jgi:hypothetical protein
MNTDLLADIRRQEMRADDLTEIELEEQEPKRQLDLACIAADIASGATLSEAAKRYGISTSTLRRRLKAAGLPVTPPAIDGRTRPHATRPRRGRPPKNGSCRTNGAQAIAEPQPVVDDARQAAKLTSTGHANGAGALESVEARLDAHWQALGVAEKLDWVLRLLASSM